MSQRHSLAHPNVSGSLRHSARVSTATRALISPGATSQKIARAQDVWAVLDFRSKLDAISGWFTASGDIREERLEDVDDLIARLTLLSIGRDELQAEVSQTTSQVDSVAGILIYADLARLWTENINEPWRYQYCYGPYLDREALSFATQSGIKSIGTDGLRLEDPIANFLDAGGAFTKADESLTLARRSTRAMVEAAIAKWREEPLLSYALAEGLILYENLNIPAELVQKTGFLEISSPVTTSDTATLSFNVSPYFVTSAD